MKTRSVLKYANWTLALGFIAFCFAFYVAYAYESALPLLLVSVLHVLQLLLAGVVKVAYVVRLVSQKQLGLTVS